jgi:hypothetical protein
MEKGKRAALQGPNIFAPDTWDASGAGFESSSRNERSIDKNP